jgi:hypothetical protein
MLVAEKELKEQHLVIVETEEKVRRMYDFIKAHRSKAKADPEPPVIPIGDQIELLQEEIARLQD